MFDKEMIFEEVIVNLNIYVLIIGIFDFVKQFILDVNVLIDLNIVIVDD